MGDTSQHTPAMRQVPRHQIPSPQQLVFLSYEGDFYELFYDDAKRAAELLDITLTHRGQSAGAPSPWQAYPITQQILHRSIGAPGRIGRHL